MVTKKSGASVPPSGSRQEQARGTGNLAPGCPLRLLKLARLQVLQVRPGDVVVLVVPGSVSMDTVQRLSNYFEARTGVRAMVLGDGMTVQGVLRGMREGSDGENAAADL